MTGADDVEIRDERVAAGGADDVTVGAAELVTPDGVVVAPKEKPLVVVVVDNGADGATVAGAVVAATVGADVITAAGLAKLNWSPVDAVVTGADDDVTADDPKENPGVEDEERVVEDAAGAGVEDVVDGAANEKGATAAAVVAAGAVPKFRPSGAETAVGLVTGVDVKRVVPLDDMVGVALNIEEDDRDVWGWDVVLVPKEMADVAVDVFVVPVPNCDPNNDPVVAGALELL